MKGKLQWMINWILLVAVVILAAGLISVRKTTKIAVIDSARVLKGMDNMLALEKRYQQKQKVIDDRSDTLRSEIEMEILEHDKPGLTPGKKDEIAKQIVKKRNDMLRYQEVMQQKLKDEKMDELKHIIEPVDQLVDDYAKKHHYSVVMSVNNSNVLYASEYNDITDKIIELLNRDQK